MTKYLRLNYFYLLLVLTWIPIQQLILKFDGAGRTVLLATLVAVFVNIHRRTFLRIIVSKPFIFWGIWVIYAFINTLLLGYNYTHPYYSFFIRLFVPLVVLWVVSFEYRVDEKRLLNVIIGSLLLGNLVILLFEGSTARTSSHMVRLGNVLNANEIAIYALILFTLLNYKLYSKHNTTFQKIIIALICLIPAITIFKSGSRAAFGIMGFILFGQVIINRSKDFLKTIPKYVIGFVALALIFNYILFNTGVGKRLLETTRDYRTQTRTTGTILDRFGDRGIYYVMGSEIFTDNPIRGIGLNNFINYHGRQQMHPEYMIQLTELGIIGSILFVLFYFWIGKGLVGIRKYYDRESKKNIEYLILAFFGLLFLGTTIWFYSNPVVFALLGFMVSQIIQFKYQVHRVAL